MHIVETSGDLHVEEATGEELSIAASAATARWRADRYSAYAWHAFLFVSCTAVAVVYVLTALRIQGNNDNDAAYYLGVARHIARTGRLEENIVWHFLNRPASVFHAPFSYWQGLTSMLLVPVVLVSKSPQAPFVFMALVSGCTLLLLWYLVVFAAPLRHPLAQWATLFVFALSPAMRIFRFDTDTVAVTQLWLVGSLIALARKRLKTAACMAFLMALTRGDGAILAAIMWGACCIASLHRSARLRILDAVPLVATVTVLVMAYVGWCRLLHGTFTPRPMRMAPRLLDYFDLYAFARRPQLEPWPTHLRFDALTRSLLTAFNHLFTTPFSTIEAVWLAMILTTGWRKSRWPLTGVVWALLFGGSTIIVFATGMLFSPWRTLFPLLPAVALAGGAALDDVMHRSSHDRVARRGAGWVGLVAGGLSIALVGAMVAKVEPLAPEPNVFAELEGDLRSISTTLNGDTVATVRPFSVIANTVSPAVMIPSDGEDALAAALDFYDVRWLILSNEACPRDTSPVCQAIRDGSRTTLGPFQLVEGLGAGSLRLFHLEKRASL